MEQNTGLMITNDDTGMKGQLMSSADSFCSMLPKNDEERKVLFNAMNNPQERLSNFINMEIAVKDIYSEMVDLLNENTGEVTRAPRIVLIDENGVGYQCVSQGIFNGVKKLIQIYGVPTWVNPVRIRIKQIQKSATKNILTMEIV